MTAISTSKPKLTPAKLAPIGIALTGLTSLGVYQLLRAQPLHTQPAIQPAKSYAEALTKIEASTHLCITINTDIKYALQQKIRAS